MSMRLVNDESVPRLSDELVRANLRRLREEPGNRRWHTDETDALGHLTWDRIAAGYEAAGGPPVSPETLRTDWFGTRKKVRRYGWEQLIHLARALDVSLFEIILPTEDDSLGIHHAAEVFRMPVRALRSQSRLLWSTQRHRAYILHRAILWHPWIADLKDQRDKAIADGTPAETAYEYWFNEAARRTDAFTDDVRDKPSPTLDAFADMMAEQGALTFGGSETREERLPGDYRIPREEAFTILRELRALPEGAG